MIESILTEKLSLAVKTLYQQELKPENFLLQKTRPEFEGDITVVVFPMLKISRKSPEATAQDLGSFLEKNTEEVIGFNVIKGFLNLVIDDKYWVSFFEESYADENYGKLSPNPKEPPVVIEYSSPNTNKPLHLGHVRNNLLGWSIAEILKANGKNVVKVNLVNDRGIHICKSMLAWQKWGKGQTPEKSGQKGDKLVGDFYVLFDKEYKKEISKLEAEGNEAEAAAQKAPLMVEAKQMLQKWEAGDFEIRALWEEMNSWVYEGFDKTYRRMGVDFDKIYYESKTYLLGKELVHEGLEKNVFYKKEDGSVWCDLTDEGLDEKLLLRADGTSVYMTQDLGTAHLRYEDYQPQQLIYVVGNEQNYHFDVLKLLLKKLGKSWAENIYHLSYGMVELPHGKMKSREGTVVDADELMEEMSETARKTSEELGKFDDFTKEESTQLYDMVGLGALKYFILKVDPKKTMMFNPEESIDFNGNTGPFIQYTHARIQSVLRKAKDSGMDFGTVNFDKHIPENKEKSLLKLLHDFPSVVKAAGDALSPAPIANFSFEIAKEYNQFYHDLTILKEEDDAKRNFRLALSDFTARTLRTAMQLLGIVLPERM
ncbi:MAG: arginine--tRNA ligase [Bacteroidales bacterium]|nr:arginine--tRNA ligase [Bacteroidales bacterium]